MKITCVMVTGKNRGFQNMPDVAIECFLNQSFQDCELLIINHGEKSYSGKNIRELKIKKGESLHVGGMRNMAFDHSFGEYLATWDDDDWHHPDRLKYSNELLEPCRMLMFKNRLCVDLVTGKSGVHSAARGSHNTMIFPRRTEFRFQNLKHDSDFIFAKNFQPSNVSVVDNDASLYLRTFHGENLTQNPVALRQLKPCSDSQNEQISRLARLYKSKSGTNLGIKCHSSFK